MSSRSGVIASVVIVILVFSAVGGFVFLSNQYVPSNVAVVVTNPGFNDRSMADQAYSGLFDVEVAISYSFFEAEDLDDLEDILRDNATSRAYDLIIVIGTEDGLADRIDEVAQEFPNQYFGFVGGLVNQPNVASATFAHDEAAFLAGSLAALVAHNGTGIAGIIGSVASDSTVTDLIDGFTQGFWYVNTTYDLDLTLLPTQFVASYNNSIMSQLLAQQMWNPLLGDATVIFAPVRASINGIRTAMEYANETWFQGDPDREPFVIAAEGDQNYMGNPNIDIRTGPSWVLASVVQRSDQAVYRIINAMLWDNFTGDLDYGGGLDTRGNLTNNGIGLSDMEEFQNTLWVNDHMINVTLTIRLWIINGTIVLNP